MRTINKMVIQPNTPNDNKVLWLNGNNASYYNNGTWVTIGKSSEDRQELEEKVDNLDKEVDNIQKDVAVLNSKAVVELEIGNSESIKANNLAKLQAIQSVDHLFFADIDYGYGAAKWLPTTGGEAFIVTSSGRAVIYTIGKDGSVTKASTDIDLTNPNTDLFEVVTELPTENISTSKLYCVLSSKVGEENKYTEYAYIKQTDGQFAWEKMGEFQAEPNLSGYAKLTDIGAPENFTFTLEDGSTVTKSIRVISTTSQAGA